MSHGPPAGAGCTQPLAQPQGCRSHHTTEATTARAAEACKVMQTRSELPLQGGRLQVGEPGVEFSFSSSRSVPSLLLQGGGRVVGRRGPASTVPRDASWLSATQLSINGGRGAGG